VALLFADRAPGRVDGLVLVAATLPGRLTGRQAFGWQTLGRLALFVLPPIGSSGLAMALAAATLVLGLLAMFAAVAHLDVAVKDLTGHCDNSEQCDVTLAGPIDALLILSAAVVAVLLAWWGVSRSGWAVDVWSGVLAAGLTTVAVLLALGIGVSGLVLPSPDSLDVAYFGAVGFVVSSFASATVARAGRYDRSPPRRPS
jgi:hypothetical protein